MNNPDLNSDSDTLLDKLMHSALEEGGYLVGGERDLYMEVVDTTTGMMWMSSSPVSEADFAALELEPSLAKIGMAPAAMDRALFNASPGAPGEPVRERIIDGRHYINVASLLEQSAPAEDGAPMIAQVDKYHVIGFEAGRTLKVLSLPEGDFVEVVGKCSQDEGLVLPEGGQLRSITLQEPWVVHLATPTRAFFWMAGGMRSFQGPVSLPNTLSR